MGWFRWWGPIFVGDVREVIVFSGALSDGDLARFDESEKGWLSGTRMQLAARSTA
jgi:hypothetical protein